MARSLRVALALVESLSIPLLILTVLYIISGYQLLFPELNIIPMARTIHTDPILRILFVTLVYLHSLSGLVIVIERRIKSRIVKNIIRYIVVVVLTGFTVFVLLIELLYGLLTR